VNTTAKFKRPKASLTLQKHTESLWYMLRNSARDNSNISKISKEITIITPLGYHRIIGAHLKTDKTVWVNEVEPLLWT